ncbi:hypothetical protein ElyMa_004060200 [Elysia marginata]|uniref:Uncharacterized protein n=1 Tax=Elysia marginata TaxID=1093978 RepID=A0AAV4G5P9_9GAST|nr:hypothetical protein ElyMa_004060200 [Elysia marginata]
MPNVMPVYPAVSKYTSQRIDMPYSVPRCAPFYVRVFPKVFESPSMPIHDLFRMCPSLPHFVQVYLTVPRFISPSRFISLCPGIPHCVQVYLTLSRFTSMCPGLSHFVQVYLT